MDLGAPLRVQRLHDVDLHGEGPGAQLQEVLVHVLLLRGEGAQALQPELTLPELPQRLLAEATDGDLLQAQHAEGPLAAAAAPTPQLRGDRTDALSQQLADAQGRGEAVQGSHVYSWWFAGSVAGVRHGLNSDKGPDLR